MSKIPKIQARKSVKVTVRQMVPAVFTALVATVLGFIALYSSPVPMIQDFGKMLSLGMIVSFAAGIFLLIPLLYIRDGFFGTEKELRRRQAASSSAFERILKRWTNTVGKLKWIILAVAVLTAGYGILADLDAPAETDVEAFMPQESQALADIEYVRDVLGSTDQVSVMYEGDDVLSESALIWTEEVTEELAMQFPDQIVRVQSVTGLLDTMNSRWTDSHEAALETLDRLPEDQRIRFINENETKGVLHVEIEKMPAEDLEQFIDELYEEVEDLRIGSLETTVTGQSVLDVEMVSALTSGRYKMTLLGMGFVFLGLLLFYRSPVKAFIPLLPIILIVGWSGLAVYLLGIEYTPLTATLGALIIGIGTEFTILLMERYYEERRHGESNIRAIITANQKVGKAVVASALTTLAGFSALLFSDFAILSNFGMMTLINIALALVSTIVVMPALLMVAGKWIKVKTVS